MNRVRSPGGGYTIVETMIFLAVTGGLFISAMLMVSGQQAKTEFAQAVRDIQTQIQDTANDVSTGFYSNPGNIQCTNVGGAPNVSNGADRQGANQDCIFLGRFIQFAPILSPVADPEQVYTYSVVGVRKISAAKEVSNYTEAEPTAVAPSTSNPAIPDAIQKSNLQGGMKAATVRYVVGGVPTNISGFGFMSTLARYATATSANIDSGSQAVNVIPVGLPSAPPNPGKDPLAFAQDIDNIDSSTPVNPDGGIIICFNSAGTDQHANITVGIKGSLTTRVQILSGVCP